MKSNFSMKEEEEEEENKNKMDFVSRVESILINLSRRFFLSFVIHKEGKGPLIFLPISRSNFSNTWIPFEPPSHFEPIRRMKVVRILLLHDSVHVLMKYRGRIIWAWIIRGQNRDLKENDGHPASKILFLGSPGYPEISSPRNNPCPFLTTMAPPPGGEYFLFQALTETFPYWKSRISGEEEDERKEEHENYRIIRTERA